MTKLPFMRGFLVTSKQRPGTINSQIAALQERVKQDGKCVIDAFCFIDDGYSGTTLVRPALERLRDIVAVGEVEQLYVHSPDRLARKYAHQALLVDEFETVRKRVTANLGR